MVLRDGCDCGHTRPYRELSEGRHWGFMNELEAIVRPLGRCPAERIALESLDQSSEAAAAGSVSVVRANESR
jgi:hypothetical protein